MDTVRAAIALDYPKDRYRVVVLDDSVSDKIKEEIDIISSQTPNLYYTTRGIRPKTHTKAGNLNHGLEYVSTLPGGASELVAVLDVDMIPSPHWLRALIPHLLSEAKIAMASSPQRFYNIPDGDPLDQVWAILFDVLEPLKNATNSAWCCGSGFIVRRAALDGIGGVPEESLQEDILTSFYLTAAGWRIVYVHEDMQWGLVPATIGSYVKQQKRLLIGVISLIAVLWSPRARNMTIGEKFGALFPAFSFTATVIINMVSLVAMPILLVSGAPLVQYSSPSQLRIILSLLFVKFIVALSYDILCTRAANYQFKLLNGSSTWAVPHQFMAIVRSTISAFTGAGLPSFSPSGLAETKNSSSSRNTISLKTRDVIVPHVLIIASLASGLAVSVVNAAPKAADISQSIPIMFTNFLVRAGWPTIFLIWSKYITDAWTPISYAAHLAEEPWPIRKDLLDRDPVTGVAYPNQQAKDQVRVRPSQRLAVVRIVYCVGVCAAAAWSL